MDIYAWVKAFHIIAVIAWMAGMLYLPRLYVSLRDRAGLGGERAVLVPPHSDFDRLTVPWFQCGQVGTINQDSETPGHPRAP